MGFRVILIAPALTKSSQSCTPLFMIYAHSNTSELTTMGRVRVRVRGEGEG